VADALGILAQFGRNERRVRGWIEDAGIPVACDLRTKRRVVWWPDLWREHLVRKARKRAAA
jgi:hypothetical protein